MSLKHNTPEIIMQNTRIMSAWFAHHSNILEGAEA